MADRPGCPCARNHRHKSIRHKRLNRPIVSRPPAGYPRYFLPLSANWTRESSARVSLRELVVRCGNTTQGFTPLRGPGLLPKWRGFPRFSRRFAFRIQISERVSRGQSNSGALHPVPGRLPDSLFGKRGATEELTLHAAAPQDIRQEVSQREALCTILSVTSLGTGRRLWRRSLANASTVVSRSPFGEQGLPELPLFSPIYDPRQPLELTQVDRVAAPGGPRQKEYSFLQVGSQEA